MKRSEPETIQRSLIEPFTRKVKAKKTARASIVNAAFAVTGLILDTSVPTNVIKRDLEDIRETIDFAIEIMSSQSNGRLLN